jgi:hypothetical protein
MMNGGKKKQKPQDISCLSDKHPNQTYISSHKLLPFVKTTKLLFCSSQLALTATVQHVTINNHEL